MSPLGPFSWSRLRKFKCPSCAAQKAYRSRYRGILERIFLLFLMLKPVFAVTVATIVATPFERSPYLSQALVRVNSIINLSVTQVLTSALHNALRPVYTGDS